jgi:Pectate lyase superfamily protein
MGLIFATNRYGLIVASMVMSLVCNAACDTARGDRLLQAGCLDVTKAPYRADPTGVKDSTAAIQHAVNDARDRGFVCFFPEGTYLISDTISCEQPVRKLERPRYTDGHTQHYWDVPNQIVMIGSTKGKRPVLKLSKDAKGFDDPARPKLAVWIWAQTRDDAPGKAEPEWGKEQPNISFNHIFKGIDIDVRGHAGAIGIRHSGSQGSTLQDSTIYAEGAYAGMNNCCGQGGGTYNVEVLGGRYGIVIEPSSRFPILTACVFEGQTKAAITYSKGGSQVPTVLVGCRIEPAGDCAVDLTTERRYAGINMVDCVIGIKHSGVIAKTTKSENIYIENTYVKGAQSVCSDGTKLPSLQDWTHIERYSSHTDQAVNLLNGVQSAGKIVEWKPARASPSYETIRRKHYRRGPSFEDRDAVSVKSFGAKGDSTTDDTKAFEEAIASHDKIFVPKGDYRLSGTLHLRRNTQLFGLARAFTSIGTGDFGKRRGRAGAENDSFSIATVDDADAAPGLSFLTVRGRIDWRSGHGTYMLCSGSLAISGHGGGRLYGVMAMRQPFILKGIREPTSFYALNVERVLSNPQSQIEDCSHIRIYYFKVEAGTLNRPNAGDDNTPCRIANSRDIRVYCMYGNVRKLKDRPMLDVVNSDDVVVSQLKAFRPGDFPHVTETSGNTHSEVPSTTICALFVRDSQ